MKIVVVGIGYVGLSTALMFSKKHDVMLLDVDNDKISKINQRVSPIMDKEIEEWLEQEEISLKATDDVSVYKDANYILLGLPTNYSPTLDNFDTSILETVIKDISLFQPHAKVVIRSTVPIGFTNELEEKYPHLTFLFCPEFLREGTALFDALNPDRIIVGTSDRVQGQIFGQLLSEVVHKPFVPLLQMSSTEAESVKLFANTYLAMRIAFFNELDSFCQTHSLDTKKIIDGISYDERIGIGYQNPSFGYGGYCLPKDTKVLRSYYKGIPSDLMSAIVSSNDSRKQFITEEILKTSSKRIGLYRLIMKSKSDNYRESALLDIIQKLKVEGRDLIIFEPLITESEFQGVKIETDFERFCASSDIIVANRWDEQLSLVKEKVFTRDIYKKD